MADIVDRLARMTRDGYRYYDRHKGDVVHCAIQDAGKEITTLRDRCDKLEKALGESRETNRRLNRRVQISEAIQQSADDYLSAWVSVFSANYYPNDRRFKERHFIKYILRDLRYRISKLSARAALAEAKGGADVKARN